MLFSPAGIGKTTAHQVVYKVNLDLYYPIAETAGKSM